MRAAVLATMLPVGTKTILYSTKMIHTVFPHFVLLIDDDSKTMKGAPKDLSVLDIFGAVKDENFDLVQSYAFRVPQPGPKCPSIKNNIPLYYCMWLCI